MAKRALVVDDDRLIRNFFTDQLIACGFEPKTSSSLEDTIKIIHDWQPDVVMLDLRMPEHDGFEIIEQILANFPDPPKVIAVSGSVDDSTRQRAKDAGFTDFLQKPCRIAQVSAAINKAVDES